MKKILLILTALTVSAAAFAEKITTVAEITSGNRYYIGATTGGNDFYFYADGSSKTESIGGLAKTDKAEAVALTFTAVTDGWTIQFDNGLYLGLRNAKDNGKVQVMEEPVIWTIEEDSKNNLLKLHPNTSYSLQKNNSGTQFGSYSNTHTNVWLESAGSTPVSLILESVYIKGDATKKEYKVGESFDPAGLEVWGVYTKTVKNDTESQITSGITWSLDPETFEEASDNASVTLSASFKDKTSNDTTITGILVKDDDTEAPQNFSAEVIKENTTSNSVELKLYAEDESGEVIYTIKESGQIVQTANGVSGVGKTVTITDLEANKDYTFVVTAKDGAGNEGNPITLKATTLAAPTPGTSTYYLVGYINGADYGCEADIDNMGDYNLTAGPVVITFTEKSYVQVKNQNKSIYGTAYVDATEPGSTVLSVGATDKIGLPANVEITFTLTENADGTVTLAYTWGDTPTPPTAAPYLFVDGMLTIGELKDGELVYFQYFTYVDGKRVNGIAGTNPKKSFELYTTEGYAEINYTNKDDVERNFIVNPKIENAVDSIYQGETYLFADTLLTTAGTYQRTIESNTMTLTLKVKQKPVKYTTYENWQIKPAGSEWQNMIKVEEGLFKLADINWTGSGFNVKSDDNPIKKDWYAEDDPDVVIGEEVIPPVIVDVYLRVIDDETLKIGVGVEPPVGPTVDETGITVNGRKYGFPVRLVTEVK